jgi:hypothetical protein
VGNGLSALSSRHARPLKGGAHNTPHIKTVWTIVMESKRSQYPNQKSFAQKGAS